MQTDLELVIQQLDLLDQIAQLNFATPSALNLLGGDISGDLKHLGIENFYLEEPSLSAILQTIQTYQKLSTALQARSSELPLLFALFPVEDASKLIVAAIGKVLDEFGEISARATPQYAKISQEINRLEGEARNVMRGIFREWKSQGFTAETDVTVREERLVIPVLA
jgi:DNA mismatch repair protein MutS2